MNAEPFHENLAPPHFMFDEMFYVCFVVVDTNFTATSRCSVDCSTEYRCYKLIFGEPFGFYAESTKLDKNVTILRVPFLMAFKTPCSMNGTAANAFFHLNFRYIFFHLFHSHFLHN